MRREKMQVYTFEGFVKREGAQSRNKKVKKFPAAERPEIQFVEKALPQEQN